MPNKKWIENNHEKLKKYRRDWYHRNREREVKRQTESNKIKIERNKEFVLSKTKPCIVCGESEFCCIDFHHLVSENKKYNISRMIRNGHSTESIQKEIDKCCCLCSNCHRKYHAGKLALPEGIAPP